MTLKFSAGGRNSGDSSLLMVNRRFAQSNPNHFAFSHQSGMNLAIILQFMIWIKFNKSHK